VRQQRPAPPRGEELVAAEPGAQAGGKHDGVRGYRARSSAAVSASRVVTPSRCRR
jgi:hypothetical protein